MNPEPILLAEHADFLVVAKPPHLLSHPTRPDGKPTLLGWLQDKFPGEFVALVNRLDRETSGTVLVARSPEAASRLGVDDHAARNPQILPGAGLGPGRATEHGVIDAPLGRLGISETNPIWLRQGVILPDDPQGRKTGRGAVSEFWRLARTTTARSLLACRPIRDGCTNCASISRTSAIRSSATRSTAPIPSLYLKFIAEGWTEEHQRVLGLRRHALHAHGLSFPWNGEENLTLPRRCRRICEHDAKIISQISTLITALQVSPVTGATPPDRYIPIPVEKPGRSYPRRRRAESPRARRRSKTSLSSSGFTGDGILLVEAGHAEFVFAAAGGADHAGLVEVAERIGLEILRDLLVAKAGSR